MALAHYRQKRRFSVTPEPKGAAPRSSGTGNTYVVQKHDASHLHYDFRLELDGTLKSWAVPKGPSLEPHVKRLAVQVEDHPVEYAGFEGTIPQGEYGGGSVMVWDTGTWKPEGDPREELDRGTLRFELFGQKLKGKWRLTQMKHGAAAGKNWLLFKVDDEYARADGKADVLDTEPLSVVSGRTIDEIAAGDSPVWRSNRKGNVHAPSNSKPAPESDNSPSPVSPKRATRSPKGEVEVDPSKMTGAVAAPMPDRIHPQLARYVDKIPVGGDWLHEIKLDGYRLIIHAADNKARLITRQGNDWSQRFPELTVSMSRLPVKQTIFDGEVVMLMPDGKSSFQALQNHLRDKTSGSLTLFLFDLIYCNGYDLTKAPLLERKKLLQALLAGEHDPHIRFSDHILGGGQDVYQQACRMGLEGVISKRAAAPYHQSRTDDWVKTKCLLRQEFIVLGYTAPTGSRSRFGSLLLGCHIDGELKYCGKVGTGFTQATLDEVYKKLQPLLRAKPAAAPRGIPIGRPTWVEPRLVVEVEFSQWTHGHRLRQPSFQGIREDKKPAEVAMEQPKPLEKVAPSEDATKMQASSPSRRGDRAGARSKATNSKIRSSSDTVSTSEERQLSSRIGSPIIDVAGVHITHPERVIYPDLGVTKQELAEYYKAVADWVLPHVIKRPLSIVRCPQGVGHECFFQKHITENVPKHVRSLRVREEDGTEADYIAIDDLEGLIGLAQISALEIHPWGCREGHVEQPDRLIFDLDPAPGVAWSFVIETAVKLCEILQTLGLDSFVKTTGGKGLHVVVPLVPRADWTQAKAFTRAIAFAMARENPTRYIATMSKAKREGRIFIDYLRNGRGATSVAAYCTRARPGAAVSTPLSWKELGPKIAPDHFNIRNILKRLADLKTDPWKDFFKTRQSLTESMLGAVELVSGVKNRKEP